MQELPGLPGFTPSQAGPQRSPGLHFPASTTQPGPSTWWLGCGESLSDAWALSPLSLSPPAVLCALCPGITIKSNTELTSNMTMCHGKYQKCILGREGLGACLAKSRRGLAQISSWTASSGQWEEKGKVSGVPWLEAWAGAAAGWELEAEHPKGLVRGCWQLSITVSQPFGAEWYKVCGLSS